MRTAKNNRIYLRILEHQLGDAFVYKIISSGTVGFIGFHNGSPKWTSNTRHLDIRKLLLYLQVIALTLDRSLCGQDAHMTRTGNRAYTFCRRTDDAQHTAGGILQWKILLLNGT